MVSQPYNIGYCQPYFYLVAALLQLLQRSFLDENVPRDRFTCVRKMVKSRLGSSPHMQLLGFELLLSSKTTTIDDIFSQTTIAHFHFRRDLSFFPRIRQRPTRKFEQSESGQDTFYVPI